MRIGYVPALHTDDRRNCDGAVFGGGFLDIGGPILEGVWGTEVPLQGSAAKPLVRAEEKTQIVHVRKVFCVSYVVGVKASIYR